MLNDWINGKGVGLKDGRLKHRQYLAREIHIVQLE